MKRYWATNHGLIETDDGEMMRAREVLPELGRLNARIAELEATKCAWAIGNSKEECDMVSGANARITELEAESLKKSVKEWANKDKEKIDALEKRIAELEAALDETKTEDGRQKAHIAKLYSSIDGLKTELTEERLKKFAPLLPSEMCAKHQVQNCHCCDKIDCGDNTSAAKQHITELEDANQWHDASEPPECKEDELFSRRVLIQEKNGDCFTDWYCYESKTWYFSKRIIRWRDLPPAPEVKA